ncbi:hypothetical protein [uncultured Olegusella sp.]|uniref:hypothetical protein n=1 Tax=uncultured Olegusella sp. TaxID=1979846 RepID=UPI0026239896|nr:hypothetical protein [uncultured Olegusella sp.]
MYKRQDISIDKLIINDQNPRIFPVMGEQEAIYSILRDQSLASRENKIITLAKDIALNGLHEEEPFVVSPLPDGMYLVREGNRRATALKLGNNPELVPSGFANIVKAMSDLQGKMPQIIHGAIITDNESEINRIISSRHSGPQGGIGIESWDSEQKARFQQLIENKPDGVIAFIDQIKDLFSDNTEFIRNLSQAKKTGIERMLGTPQVRTFCGIEGNRSDYQYDCKHDKELFALIQYLANHKVGDYYTADNRREIVKQLSEDLGIAPQDEQLSIPLGPLQPSESQPNQDIDPQELQPISNLSEYPSSTNGVQPSNPRPKGYAFERRTVIPSSGAPLPTTDNAKIAEISNELKSINAKDNPIACGLLLRSLIELIADTFLIHKLGDEAWNSLQSLSARISKSCELLTRDKSCHLGHNDVDYLRKMAKNNDAEVIVTITSLNSCAHGQAGWVDGGALIATWDKIYPVLREMLSKSQ